MPIDFSRRVAFERLAAMPDDELLEAFKEAIDDDEQEATVEDARMRYRAALDVVYGHSREVGTFTAANRVWVISGGMSWGDLPTDACTDIDLVAELPLTYETYDVGIEPDRLAVLTTDRGEETPDE